MSGSSSRKPTGDKGKGVQQNWAGDSYTPEPPQIRSGDFDLNFSSPIYTPDYDNDGNPISRNFGVPSFARNLDFEFTGGATGYQLPTHFLADPPTAEAPTAAAPTAEPPTTSPGLLRLSSSQSSRSRMSGDSTYLPLIAGTQVHDGIEDLTLGQEEERLEEEAEEEEEEGTQRGSQSRPRGQQYNLKADMILLRAWLQISQDPKIGTDQSGSTFWGKIHKKCIEDDWAFFSQKTARSCKSRWGRCSRDVNKFCGIYARNSGSRARSGENEASYYKNSVEEFNEMAATETQPSYWKWKEHWEMLRNHPKWLAYQSHPLHESMTYRVRGSGSGSGGEGSGSGSGKRAAPCDSGSIAATRPLGREAAKRAAKGKGKMTRKQFGEEKKRINELRADLASVELRLTEVGKQLMKMGKQTEKQAEIMLQATRHNPTDTAHMINEKQQWFADLRTDYNNKVKMGTELQNQVAALKLQKQQIKDALASYGE